MTTVTIANLAVDETAPLWAKVSFLFLALTIALPAALAIVDAVVRRLRNSPPVPYPGPPTREIELKTICPDEDAFVAELAALLNRHNVDSTTQTPDYILAEMVVLHLGAWNESLAASRSWHGWESLGERVSAR